MSKKKGLFSSKKFRHGSMAILFTVVFAVALVLLNIVATALSERFPLTIDLTANQDYTITLAEQHEVFVRAIDNDINVIVCAGSVILTAVCTLPIYKIFICWRIPRSAIGTSIR